jgi:hypothetical protein
MESKKRFSVSEQDGLIFLKDNEEVMRFSEIDTPDFCLTPELKEYSEHLRAKFSNAARKLNLLLENEPETLQNCLEWLSTGDSPEFAVLASDGFFFVIKQDVDSSNKQYHVTVKDGLEYKIIWSSEIECLYTEKDVDQFDVAVAQMLDFVLMYKRLHKLRFIRHIKELIRKENASVAAKHIFPAIDLLGKPAELLDPNHPDAQFMNSLIKGRSN